MAKTKFKLEVLTPEGEVFNDEVEMVSTKTTVGSIGVLAHHQPLLAMLEPAELRLYRSESDVTSYVQGEGYLQVQPPSEEAKEGRVLILVDEVFEPGTVDVSEMKSKLERAQGELDKADRDSHEFTVAKRDVARYEAFVKLCESGSGS
jgi:F-type H+-transporting ATPase subunit epsilon